MGVFFKIRYGVYSAAAYLFAAFFPLQTCLSCGKNSLYLPLCSCCRSELEKNIVPKEKRCIFCGRILISEKQSCSTCRTSGFPGFADGIFPLYPYILWKKELLFRWKISGNRAFSPFFARLLFFVLQRYYAGFPVVPVPPRPGKIKKEGWDQIDDLCRYLRGLYGIHIYKPLRRLSSEQQKKLSREKRLAHTGKRYALKKKFQKLPETLVLLDDIVTTGATVQECASVLKAGGVQKVYVLTLFGSV